MIKLTKKVTWLVKEYALFIVILIMTLVIANRADQANISPNLTAPSLSIPGGYYARDISIEMHVPTANARVIYTLDGSEPTAVNGITYTQSLELPAAPPQLVVIRARAIRGEELSPATTASYIMNVSTTLPIISLVINPTDLWHLNRGIYANPEGRGAAWERAAHITYVETNRATGFVTPVGVRVHGNASRYFSKKSLRLYFRAAYGNARLDYPLFGATAPPTFKRLVLHSGSTDSANKHRWTLLRNQLVSDLALQLGHPAAHGQYVLLFLNGQMWGIYNLRERIDQFFLHDHYGMEDADLLIRLLYPNLGTMERWNALFDFATTHDLRDAEHYAYVAQHIDIDNLIDYSIIKLFIIDTDWPGGNIQQVQARVDGSKWHWFLWDVDYSLNLREEDFAARRYLADLGVFGNSSDKFIHFLNSLLENPHFRRRFVTRAADLLNTELAPDNLLAALEQQVAPVAPNIHYELTRWHSRGFTDWHANVEAMRDFVSHRAPYLREDIMNEAELPGTAIITFTNDTPERGYLVVNGFPITAPSWSGIYFLNTTIEVTAVPTRGYRFNSWNDSQYLTATATISVTNDYTIAPHFTAAPPDEVQPYDVLITEWGANDDGNCYDTIAGKCIAGDWVELLVTRAGGVDLRGWRLTNNDTKTASDEGTLIFAQAENLTQVRRGTTVLVIGTANPANAAQFPQDDVDDSDGQMILYAGNDIVHENAHFGLRAAGDNLALLTPNNVGVDFVAWGRGAVTSSDFGILSDGIPEEPPAPIWGSDTAAFFTAKRQSSYAARFVADTPQSTATPGRNAANKVVSR